MKAGGWRPPRPLVGDVRIVVETLAGWDTAALKAVAAAAAAAGPVCAALVSTDSPPSWLSRAHLASRWRRRSSCDS